MTAMAAKFANFNPHFLSLTFETREIPEQERNYTGISILIF